MASNPGPADAANTAVRAFLYKAGARLLGSTYNIKSGNGKDTWNDIVENVFSNKCIYCGLSGIVLTLDHIDMINRTSLGLHHPGNTGPSCKPCQTRKQISGKYPSWEEHLLVVCKNRGEDEFFEERSRNIRSHREVGEYALPNLSQSARNSLRIICTRLYRDVTDSCNDSVDLYEELLKAFDQE